MDANQGARHGGDGGSAIACVCALFPASRTLGNRLDASTPWTESGGAFWLAATDCGRDQVISQRADCPQRCQQSTFSIGTGAIGRACHGSLGSYSIYAQLGRCQRRRGVAGCAGDDVDGCLRRHHRWLGIEFQVRVYWRDALRSTGCELRNCNGFCVGGWPDGSANNESHASDCATGRTLRPAGMVFRAAVSAFYYSFHRRRGRDQSPSLRRGRR